MSGHVLKETDREAEEGGVHPIETSLEPELGAWLSDAIDLQQAGRIGEAEQNYRAILELHPECAEAFHLSGLIAYQRGELQKAIALIEKAIRIKADNPSFHSNLGNVLLSHGNATAAVECYDRAIALKRASASAWSGKGLALQALEKLEEAAASFEQALRLMPGSPEFHCNLGNLRIRQGRIEEAIQLHRKAIELRPEYADAWSNLGAALSLGGEAGGNLAGGGTNSGRLSEAAESFARAIELKPDFPEGYSNLGQTLQMQSKLYEARACYDQALGLDPTSASAHTNRALLKLLLGDLSGGFEEYEWRWQLQPRRKSELRRWRGERFVVLPGKQSNTTSPTSGSDGPPGSNQILLYAEQGMGDTIQFLRYVPLVQARGGKVVLEVQRPLVRLARGLAAESEVVVATDDWPACAWACPMMSLPLAFGTELGSIDQPNPAGGRYLAAPEEAKRRVDRLVGAKIHPEGLRVGLVWAGNPSHRRDRYRSIPLAAFGPVLKARGACFYSLQLGAAATELEVINSQAEVPGAPERAGPKIIDLTDAIEDFGDTAALVEELDLVISVDTAVAHLAGALGKPVWLLLPTAPDWRWFMGRADSPWYPTMRLFRQAVFEDWTGVIESVREALDQLIREHAESIQETIP